MASDKKLSPTVVRKRIVKLNATMDKLRKDLAALLTRCSHKGCVNSYTEYQDSGWECSVCHRTWNRMPDDV